LYAGAFTVVTPLVVEGVSDEENIQEKVMKKT
jgi:hypothetical protein